MSLVFRLARRLRIRSAPTLTGWGQHRCLSPATPRRFSTERLDIGEAAEEESLQIERILEGQSVRFGTGTVANLADACVMGTSGDTLVLSTVSTAPADDESSESLVRALRSFKSDNVAMTVSYQERYHGVGKIPTSNRLRRDTMRTSDDEVLAARAVDRALRPLLKPTTGQVHVSCSVQAHTGRGNPVALALNAASAALGDRLSSRVAAVHLCLDSEGTVIFDPTHSQIQESVTELLLAGTRDKIVMLEATSHTDVIPEEIFVNLMKLAHGALQPILETQELLVLDQHNEEPSDVDLLASLGLTEVSVSSDTDEELEEKAASLFEEAYAHCHGHLSDAAVRLCGYKEGMTSAAAISGATIHLGKPLLPKSTRGRREHLLRLQIERLLREHDTYESHLDGVIPVLTDAIHKKLVRSALHEASSKYGARADARGDSGTGLVTVRPLSVTVPALPDVVHGSSMFSRGDTQVLCTATLGAPRDGVPLDHPYQQKDESKPRAKGAFDDLPVGSLRYSRSQEALISDFNSKRVTAEKEMTGDSGTLDEVRRFFLQYDFPSFSKGEVPSRKGNRREVGHGRLAERALQSSIPPASDFPYAVRVTSEVTSSNGSSSMASVCGATLALLDAGVPLVSPVAGVSVGLILGESQDDYSLLLDITGTEDHYGDMDFKVAGTEEGITALQLDVKTPLSVDTLDKALQLAREGRVAILSEMDALARQSSADIICKLLPRPTLKDSAPRVEVIRFDPIRKKDLIGPGGTVLRQLEDRFGISLDLTQEGQCILFGQDRDMVSQSKAAVMDLVADVEEGQVYEGTIVEIKDFGAIVELLRNKEGLLHVSELTDDLSHPEGNYGVVHSRLRVGQKIEVLCTGVDPVQGSIRLSRKALLAAKREEMEKRLD